MKYTYPVHDRYHNIDVNYVLLYNRYCLVDLEVYQRVYPY